MSEGRLLHSVQRLAAALARLERQAAADGGVTVSQLRVLVYLDQTADGVRMSDLALDQGLAVSTMTRNVAVLARKGWVTRQAGGSDKRTVQVSLTEEGRRMAKSLQGVALGKLSRAFHAFHPSDRVERAVALDRVAAAIERVGEQGE